MNPQKFQLQYDCLCVAHLLTCVCATGPDVYVFVVVFQSASVLFAPSHTVSLLTVGTNTALVMDAGYNETVVIPVSFISVITM